MKIIIDSGGSKTDWAFCNDDKVVIYSTTSLSIYGTKSLSELLSKEYLEYLRKASSVHYYGTGIIGIESASRVKSLLGDFHLTENIFVYDDMTGAARAVMSEGRGVVCILGTGSNTCFFDGVQCHEMHPSLGFIIGDEGSGSDIGKEVLKAYFYGTMSKEISTAFIAKYGIDKPSLLSNLRESLQPARYLAQFAAFPNLVKNDELLQLVSKQLKAFLVTRVMPFDEYLDLPIHFVGSIAYFYAYLIEPICTELGLTVGNILEKPINGLINYHNE